MSNTSVVYYLLLRNLTDCIISISISVMFFLEIGYFNDSF